MIHEELTVQISGAAMEVFNQLKPGLYEKLYQRALIIELKHREHIISVQRSFPVWYRGELIGNLIPDLIVDNSNDRLFEHHGIRSRASAEFQKRATSMETRLAPTRARPRHPA